MDHEPLVCNRSAPAWATARRAFMVARGVTLGTLALLCLGSRDLARWLDGWAGPYAPAAGCALTLGALVFARVTAPVWLRFVLTDGARTSLSRDWATSGVRTLLTTGVGIGLAIGSTAVVAVSLLPSLVMLIRRFATRSDPPTALTGELPQAARTLLDRAAFAPDRVVFCKGWDDVPAGMMPGKSGPYMHLSPTLLRSLSEPEVTVIVAHELGHVRFGDLGRLRLLSIAFLLAKAPVAVLVLAAASPAGGSAGSTVAAMPSAVAAVAVFETLSLPLWAWLGRQSERRANNWALQATSEPGAFLSAVRKLYVHCGAPPEPTWWERLIFCDHPSLAEVVAQADRFAAPGGPDRPPQET